MRSSIAHAWIVIKMAKSRTLILLVCVLLHMQEHTSSGAHLNEFVRHYEPLLLAANFTSETTDSISSQFHFRAHGRDFNLHVETHQGLFHPDFQLTVVEEGGKVVRKNVDTRHIVKGYIEGEEFSFAHGQLRDGVFDGVIHTESETYHIEPLTKHLTKSETHNVVIYRASDVVYDLKHTFCSSAESPRLRMIQESAGHIHPWSQDDSYSDQLLRRKRVAVDQDRNTCHMRVVADYPFFSNVGDSQESTTMAEMVLHVTDADGIYRSTSFIGRQGEFSGFGVAIVAAEIYKNLNDNPLVGQFSVEELLEAFSEQNFDDVCLGHLFTYRDFQGTIGLAYLGDPNGQTTGGICQRRVRTRVGDLNLNTGFTSLLNFGRQLPRSVSLITTAHEIGHNHGSPHDPPGPCAPGGTQGNYIMFASATDGSRPNNRQFSSCSRDAMGRTIETSGGCFIPRPSQQECGNGIVEGDEECDCGSDEPATCELVDPCCKPGNCTLKETARCSAEKSPCCNSSTCDYATSGVQCLQGDGECQQPSVCNGTSPTCPLPPAAPDRTPCNYDPQREQYNSVCIGGVCNGSLCLYYNTDFCYCSEEEQLCEVCCIFDGQCISTFERQGMVTTTTHVAGANDTYVQSGYPCRNFTGYCTAAHECIFIDNDTPLDNLRDILLDFSSIVRWIRNNWYWVLAGFGGMILLIILLQITYRRKKKPDQGRRSRRDRQTYGYYQTTTGDDGQAETSGLLENRPQTTRT